MILMRRVKDDTNDVITQTIKPLADHDDNQVDQQTTLKEKNNGDTASPSKNI
jgi:hypothetical protein